MTAQANPNNRPRLSIPEGAMVILPLRNTVLFPSTIMPLMVGRPTSLQVVEEAVRQQTPVGFIAQRDPQVETPRPEDLFPIGTAADILRMFSLPDGQRQVIIQGRQRFETTEYISTDPYLIARVTLIEEQVPTSKSFEARILNLRQEAVKALTLLPEPMAELRSTIERIDNPLALMDIIASTLDAPVADKQEILSTLDTEARAQKVSERLPAQTQPLALSQKVGHT